MAVDHFRYDLLAQDALRDVVRRVLADVAKNGLPGEHHFYIAFNTRDPGVRLSARLREKYPEEMTVVLQHQFWDLIITDHGFEVGLSFNGVPERLVVPFQAIKGFFDPSVQFGLQFDVMPQAQAAGDALPPAPAATAPAAPAEAKPDKARPTAGPRRPSEATTPAAAPAAPAAQAAAKPRRESARQEATDTKPDARPPAPSGGAEVVRLDRFRKK
jgi:hypothetical protein